MNPAPTDPFAPAEAVADAVLYEGYVLYPYRASDTKNRARWQWGVLVPPAYREVDPQERSSSRTDFLVEGESSRLRIRVRFLQVQRRRVEAAGPAGYEPVASLDVEDTTHLPFDEAVQHDLDVDVPVAACLRAPVVTPLTVGGGSDAEELRHADGTVAGRLVRARLDVHGELRVECRRTPGPYGLVHVRAELRNTTAGDGYTDRAEALCRSLVSAHLLVATDTRFVSLLEPPEWAQPFVDDCDSVGTFPVLAGEPGRQDLLLSSPIILYDHPSVAPESAASFMDATEIDELLSLRTLTLTEEEKRQARGTDPRAAALIEHVEDMPAEMMDRLHGAIRYLGAATREVHKDPVPTQVTPGAPGLGTQPAKAPWWDPGADAAVSPESDSVLVAGIPLRKGSRVLLHPGRRRADAQDMFLVGRPATVAAVLFDVDGDTHLAVTVDDDPETAEMQRAHGRYLYFAPDEVEPLEVG